MRAASAIEPDPVHRLQGILASLHQATLDDAKWPTTSALIDDTLGAHGNSLVFGDGRSEDDVRIFLARFFYRGERRADWEREYFDVYYPLDERVPRLRHLPDSQVVHMTDLYTEQERKNSVAYNDVLARGYVQNSLNVRLDGPEDSRIVWVINDPVDGNGWPSARIDMVRRLLPHLRQYVWLRQALAEAGALGASLAGLLDKTEAGIIHLDGRGRIVEANDHARDFLRDGDAICDGDGSLRARFPDDDAVLQRLLGQALPRFGGRGASGSMMLRPAAAVPGLVLHVNPVASGETDFFSRRIAALVLVVDRRSRLGVDPDLVEEVLGLTSMEARLAAWLAEGKTVRDVAAMTGRSENTIRWHIQQVFQKLGLSRQMELVRMVLSLTGAAEPERPME